MSDNTSIFFKYDSPKISFEVMGLDKITSDFLNWCLSQRDNLEFIRQCKTLEKVSQASVLHSDHLMIIKKIEDVVKHERI